MLSRKNQVSITCSRKSSSYDAIQYPTEFGSMRKHGVVTTKNIMMNEKRSIFPSEEELVRAIISAGNRVGRGATHRRLNVLREFDTSVGRADVVFFHLRREWRKHASYARVPSRWIYALRTLPFRTKFTPDEFASMSGVSRNTAMLTLRRYEAIGYCKRSIDKGFWVKVRQPVPIVKKIIAIEAKLMDWKRAISQAYRYQRYASQSWVILDASRARGAIAAKKEFQRLNVGLKVLTQDGKAKTYFTPRALPPKSMLHFWEANGLIATSLCF